MCIRDRYQRRVRGNSSSMASTFALLTACLLAVSTSASTSTVYIIRHGEKKWVLGCLSDAGQARANALPGIFDGRPSSQHATFQVPTAMFANYYDDPVDCERCEQTLMPISKSLNVTIDHKQGYPPWVGGNKGAAAAIKQATGVAPVILVAWEHENIQFLTADLGVPKASIPAWSNNDYDTVYQLQFSDGVMSNFSVAAENFNRSTH
eukprot:TRINITY_DN1333_c0_g1_i1.p1 TRINITY_DN1333_c0_g1~~TRINITY_DN1333_c0_g1_i1.p1  ORF type:complete len:207 (+),score=41.78 TRINITY_DN1333_c0_g1_i1:102-722(+)